MKPSIPNGYLQGLCLLIALPWALFGQGQLTCERLDRPVTVRAEGVSELVGDLVLRCTGGTPTAAGVLIPTFQVIVASSVPLTSKVLVPGTANNGLSEALLLIDEPGFHEQRGCATTTSGDGCPAIAGSTQANVFQGRQLQANALTFRSVPIDPPGPNGTRILRIANLRANAAALTTQSPRGDAVRLSVQMLDSRGVAITIRNSDKNSIEAINGAKIAVRTLADTAPALNGNPVITIPPASLPVGAPQAVTGFNIKYTEGFVGAFRRRNVGTSSESPLFMTVQAVPDLAYNTESGFLNTLFPSVMKMGTAGLADTGTRLWVRFQNVPKDVLIWVTVRDVRAGTTQFSDVNARAMLTVADANATGPFMPVRASINGLAQVPVVSGTATAVWEIVSANPTSLQNVSFGVSISAQTANPAQGLVTITGGLGPLGSDLAASLSIPAFKQPETSIPAFAVSNLITVPALNCVSAASYLGPDAAPGSIVAAFGRNMGILPAVAEDTILPISLSGATVDLIDTTGTKRSADLLFVSPSQVNFIMSNQVEPGPVLVNLLLTGRLIASGYVQVSATAPSLFSANGTGEGVAAGEGLLSSGAVSFSIPIATYDFRQSQWVAVPIKFGQANDMPFLTLYGTGIRGRRNVSQVHAIVGGLAVPVTYAGPQGFFSGLDQINIGPLPRSLAGKGMVDIQVTVGSQSSNPVQVYIE